MKYLLLTVTMICIGLQCFSQDSVLLKGPYTPKSKYDNTVVREMSLHVRPEGDSSVVAQMRQSGAFGPTAQKDTFRSHAVVLTSKANANGRYSVVTKLALTGASKPPFDFIVLYASAHKDSVPQIDSISFEPNKADFDMYKKQALQNFRNIFSYLAPPNRYFHKGDTASTVTVIPASIIGIRMNFIIHSVYRLTDIHKGLAYFDLQYDVVMKFPPARGAVMEGKGSGSGSGKFIYNIRKEYFPLTESTINTESVMKFYNPSNNQFLKLNTNESVHSLVTLKKIK